MACNGLTIGSFHLFRHPKRSGIILEIAHLLPIFDPFLVPKLPRFQTILGSFEGQNAQHGLKMCQKQLFWHSTWSEIIFKKTLFVFCTRWTLLTHFGTQLFGVPLAACRSSLGLGTGV